MSYNELVLNTIQEIINELPESKAYIHKIGGEMSWNPNSLYYCHRKEPIREICRVLNRRVGEYSTIRFWSCKHEIIIKSVSEDGEYQVLCSVRDPNFADTIRKSFVTAHQLVMTKKESVLGSICNWLKSLYEGMSTVLDLGGVSFYSARVTSIPQADEEAWERNRQALDQDLQQVYEDLQRAVNKFKYHS